MCVCVCVLLPQCFMLLSISAAIYPNPPSLNARHKDSWNKRDHPDGMKWSIRPCLLVP